MKYVKILLFMMASVMYMGCAEDPFDWSGDSDRTVPVPVELSLEFYDGVLSASCRVEQHDDDLEIIECGFFYGSNEKVTYSTGGVIKSKVVDGWMSGSKDGMDEHYCYVYGYITTSRGMVTVGPKYAKY